MSETRRVYVVCEGSSSPTVLASKIISETVFDGFEVLGRPLRLLAVTLSPYGLRIRTQTLRSPIMKLWPVTA